MKLKLYSFISFLVFIVLVSCKSASKLYEKGNYDEAVALAAKKLQKDPNDHKLQGIVKDAYRFAVNDHESRIRSISESRNDSKWEELYNEYASLQSLYNAIYRAPSVYELVNPTDYTNYLNTYADKAAGVRYNRGMSLMETGRKLDSRQAYHEFQAAAHLKPGDEEIKRMIRESYDAALVRVVVMPADDYDYRFSRYGYENTSFDQNELVRKLQYNSGNEFVKFYSSWDANRQSILPDEIMELHFTRMTIGGLYDQSSSREVYKDVVVKETVYRPDSVVKEYAKVKARITTTKRTMVSEGLLTVSIRDNNGRWLWNDHIRGEHNWMVEFSTFTGDERALTDADKNLLNRQQQTPPDEREVIRCIRESIYNDFVYKIRNYYSRI